MGTTTKLSKNSSFLVAFTIILFTFIILTLIFLRIYRIPFYYIEIFGISNSPVHWLGWIGTLFIAITIPIYFFIKRKMQKKIRGMLKIHVFGNLLSVTMISIHFAHQVTRPASNYPELGTGIVLYSAMILLVSTGFLQYFGLAKSKIKAIKFLHPAIALTFYLTIIMHILHGI